MHRMLIAVAAASALAAAGSAQAGWDGYSDWSSASPCGCQGYGYDRSGDWNYGYEGDYDIPFQPDEAYDYGPAYDYGAYGDYGYGRGYDYGRSYYVAPGYGRYTNSYDYDDRYRPRSYGYRRAYRYTAPHYRSYRYERPRYYGHTSADGERG